MSSTRNIWTYWSISSNGPQILSRGWKISHIRKDWKNYDFCLLGFLMLSCHITFCSSTLAGTLCNSTLILSEKKVRFQWYAMIWFDDIQIYDSVSGEIISLFWRAFLKGIALFWTCMLVVFINLKIQIQVIICLWTILAGLQGQFLSFICKDFYFPIAARLTRC